jgi:hypothetical protein
MSRLIPISLLLAFFWVKSFAQDTIIFEKNVPYLAYVLEEQPQDVIFRKINIKDSLMFVIDKRFIKEIHYQDPKMGRQPIKTAPASLVKPLDVWITPSDSVGIFKGSLQSLNDTTLFLKKKKKLLEGTKGLKAEVVHVFPYKKIHEMKVRQRNKVRQYATFGAIGGFALGTLTGMIIFKDEPPCDPIGPDGRPCDESLFSPQSKFDKSLLLGFSTGSAGFLAGGIVGSIRITIPIGSQKDNFRGAIPKLKRLSRQQ